MYDRIDNSTCCYHGGKTDFERRHGVTVSVSISSIFTRLFERYLESIDRTSNAFRFNVSIGLVSISLSLCKNLVLRYHVCGLLEKSRKYARKNLASSSN